MNDDERRTVKIIRDEYRCFVYLIKRRAFRRDENGVEKKCDRLERVTWMGVGEK